jgi:hypothetical protein
MTKLNWITQKGKYVKLIENTNPWYINKTDTPVKPKGIVKRTRRILNNHNEYRFYDSADYKSKSKLDLTRPDMGYGYSFGDRARIECFEQNEKNDEDNQSYNYLNILFYLLLIYFIIKIKK